MQLRQQCDNDNFFARAHTYSFDDKCVRVEKRRVGLIGVKEA